MKKKLGTKDYTIFILATLCLSLLVFLQNKTVEFILHLVFCFIMGCLIANSVDFFRFKKKLMQHPKLFIDPGQTVMRNRVLKCAGKNHKTTFGLVGMALMITSVMFIHNDPITGAAYFSLRMFIYVKSNNLLTHLTKQEEQ